MDNKADITIRTSNGRNAFYFVPRPSQHDCSDIMNMLVDNKVDINAIETVSGWTPLMVACALAERKTIQILLDNNADISIRNSTGMTALLLSLCPPWMLWACCLIDRQTLMVIAALGLAFYN